MKALTDEQKVALNKHVSGIVAKAVKDMPMIQSLMAMLGHDVEELDAVEDKVESFMKSVYERMEKEL